MQTQVHARFPSELHQGRLLGGYFQVFLYNSGSTCHLKMNFSVFLCDTFHINIDDLTFSGSQSDQKGAHCSFELVKKAFADLHMLNVHIVTFSS